MTLAPVFHFSWKKSQKKYGSDSTKDVYQIMASLYMPTKAFILGYAPNKIVIILVVMC